MAYEFVPVMGSLSLAAGKQTITLSITNAPAGKSILAFRSLELTPLSAKAAIEADGRKPGVHEPALSGSPRLATG